MEKLPFGDATTSSWKDVCNRLNASETHFPNQLCRSWWSETRKKGDQQDVSEFVDETLNQLLDEVLASEVTIDLQKLILNLLTVWSLVKYL